MKESIVKQVLLLLIVFFLNAAVFILVHDYMNRRVAYLQKLTENELVKVELSYLSHEKLQSIRSLFQDMFLSHSESELTFISHKIDKKSAELVALLQVIEQGGTITHIYDINFANKEQVERNFVYKNYYLNRINLEVLEMRAKIVELHKYADDISQLMKIAILYGSLRDEQNKSGAISDKGAISLAYKRIAPFFARLMENSHRIYFDAQAEMLKLEVVRDRVEERFAQQIFWAMIFVTMFILSLAWVILRSIAGIVRERANIQAALRASNETLEQSVFERTRELREEVDVRRRTEEEQRKQTDFLKTVIDSLGHPFYVLDINTYAINMLNKAALELGPENATFCYALTHKRDSPCGGDHHPCPVNEIRRSNKPVTMEHIHFDRNGKEIYVEVHGYPIFDESGDLSQMIEYSLDITEKKKAEMALAESNKNLEKEVRRRTLSLQKEIVQREKLQLVVEQNPSSIVITNLNGEIEYVNKQFENVTGYSREEVLGENPRILNSGLTPSETYTDMWETLEKGEIWNGEFVNQSKNKEIYHESVLLAPLKNEKGVITHYVAIKENITELKKARKVAEASNTDLYNKT